MIELSHCDRILAALLDRARGRGDDNFLQALLFMADAIISGESPRTPRAAASWDFFRVLGGRIEGHLVDRLKSLLGGVDEAMLADWGLALDRLDFCADQKADFPTWFNDRLDDPEAWVKGRWNWGVVVPPIVSRMVASIADVRPGTTVLDPLCGTGAFLAASAISYSHNIPLRLRGGGQNPDALAIAALRLFLLGKALEVIGPQNEPYGLGHADVILSAPPAGRAFSETDLRWLGYEDAYRFPPRASAEAIVTDVTVDRLRDGGCAVLLIPKGLLFRGGFERHLRRTMVSEGFVSAVVDLPAGTLAPLTHIPTALLVLRKSQEGFRSVKMIDASELGRRDRRKVILSKLDSDEVVRATRGEPFQAKNLRSADVNIPDIEANDFDLLPARYLSSKILEDVRTVEDRRNELRSLETAYLEAASRTDELIARLRAE